MNLTELKQKSVSELMNLANESELDVSRARKQDIIFSLLKIY